MATSWPDVPAEQVLDLAALAQPVDHPVEAGLHLADLAAVVDHQADVEVVVAHPGQRVAQAVERLGQRAGRRHGGDEPAPRPASDSIASARRDLVPVEEQHEAIASSGTPEPTAQVSSRRRRMPGVRGRRSGTPSSTWANSGRNDRSISR